MMGRIRSPISNICHERIVDDCPEQALVPAETTCDKLDVMFVVGRNDPSLYTGLKNGMKLFADDIADSTTDYQLGLIVVDYLGVVTEEQSFSLNNATAFKTTIDGLSDGTNTGTARDINGGLEDAVAASGWRSDPTVRKYIFFVDDFLPGGNNDTYSTTDENEFLNAATNGAASDIITSTIYLGSGFRSDSHTTEARRIYGQAATNGGGVFRDFIGTLDFGAIFREVLDALCNSDGGTDGDGYTSTSHLHCCKTAVCRLCLLHECYETDHSSFALWSDAEGAYTGTINGSTFRGYWAVRTNCYFFVEIDGVIVGVWPQCPAYGETGQDCKDLEGTIEDVVTGTYDDECSGTFTFWTYKPQRLRRRNPEYDGCSEYYCGTVDCTCRQLCVTIARNSQGAIWDDCLVQGIMDWDGEGPCDLGWALARWSGSFQCSDDTYDITATLTHQENQYTGESECLLTINATEYGGGEYECSEVITDAHSGLFVTCEIDLGDYTTLAITLQCLICGTCQTPPGQLECCDFASIGKNCPDNSTVLLCGGSVDVLIAGDACAEWQGSGSVGAANLDISINCQPALGQANGLGDYELSLNCNNTGPFPVYAYADFISCDPFVVIWTLDFDCVGVCEGEIQVVMTGDGGDLPP
jgi:hypothetical protein